MHFYYIDESGDTGGNLDDQHQPICVVGGISVRDKGWNVTHQELQKVLTSFLGAELPDGFELHATHLLGMEGDGIFAPYSLEERQSLCHSVLDILAERSHSIHYFAIDKQKMKAARLGMAVEFNPKHPYPTAFDYLVTYINWHVKRKLGKTARGMIILDQKEQYHGVIEKIMRERRYGGAAAHRVKWIAEFSYAIDSKKNPMIQFSDLVIYCIKRFIELENGYRENWPDEAKQFYAECYNKLRNALVRVTLVDREGRNLDRLNDYLKEIRAEPRTQWKRHYNIS